MSRGRNKSNMEEIMVYVGFVLMLVSIIVGCYMVGMLYKDFSSGVYSSWTKVRVLIGLFFGCMILANMLVDNVEDVLYGMVVGVVAYVLLRSVYRVKGKHF